MKNTKPNQFLKQDHERINECIHDVLGHYFNDCDDDFNGDLYQWVLAEVEKPLLEKVLTYTNYNQSQASDILGMSRTTLRKKLKQYSL